MHDSRNTKNTFKIITPPKVSFLRLRLETMMGTNRSVVTEKLQIEYGDESKLLAHLDSSDNRNSKKVSERFKTYLKKTAKFFKF